MDCSANDQADPPKFWVTRRPVGRERTEHQIAIMAVKKVIGELDKPEMAADAERTRMASKVFGHNRFRGVEGDDRDAPFAQRAHAVFGVEHRHIRFNTVEYGG